MSFFLTSSSESWQSFWRQAAGNKALYQSSFEQFCKAVAHRGMRQQPAPAPSETRWSGSTVALPSWAQMH
jgi:hypothetical protein